MLVFARKSSRMRIIHIPREVGQIMAVTARLPQLLAKPKTYQKVFVTMAAGVLMALAPAAITQAGYNGQQVRAEAEPEGRIVQFATRGHNQHDQWVEWVKPTDEPQTEVLTTNWWFKGETEAKWRLKDGTVGYCKFDVPESQYENVTRIRLVGKDCYVPDSSGWGGHRSVSVDVDVH